MYVFSFLLFFFFLFRIFPRALRSSSASQDIVLQALSKFRTRRISKGCSASSFTRATPRATGLGTMVLSDSDDSVDPFKTKSVSMPLRTQMVAPWLELLLAQLAGRHKGCVVCMAQHPAYIGRAPQAIWINKLAPWIMNSLGLARTMKIEQGVTKICRTR